MKKKKKFTQSLTLFADQVAPSNQLKKLLHHIPANKYLRSLHNKAQNLVVTNKLQNVNNFKLSFGFSSNELNTLLKMIYWDLLTYEICDNNDSATK